MRNFIGVLGIAGAFLLGACGDDDGVIQCVSQRDCADGLRCVDGACVPEVDGGGAQDAGTDAPSTDGGADAGCETMIFCGEPPMCCGAGTECIEGACVAECSSGVRCGGACCDNGTDVCIDGTCVAPGDSCGDNFDCPVGQFCEPTLAQCLPQFDPVTCETDPVFGDFAVMEEWSATTATDRPTCTHMITVPVVVDIDGDEIPEVIANMHCDEGYQVGAVRVLRGDTGETVWTSDVVTNGRYSIAAGDIGGDGRVAIIAVTSPQRADARRVVAFNADGTERWRSVDMAGDSLTIAGDNGAPNLADLDGDGRSEIILGATVLDADGRLLWTQGTGGNEGTNSGYTGGLSLVADIDGDGLMDVVSGNKAWERDGTAKWVAEVPDGYPAIADFGRGDFDGMETELDGLPEIVLVASGRVYLLDGATGEIEWGPVALPGGGRGGPPTVADFDGDGMPEIGAAGGASYTVYDPSGDSDVLWSRETVDESSNATGSSVFDFEGDGVAEVVYQDECHVWVYRGDDGSTLLSIESSSATIHEYPLVVDVDGDGNSELVTVANNRHSSSSCDSGFSGSRRGIFVYGDSGDRWVRTRRVWNQNAYSVTNVGSSGEVPAVAATNWATPGLNNFRQNSPGEAAFNAPDLTVGLEVRLDACPAQVTLRARVTNEGNLGVPAGSIVAFYDADDMEIARSMTTTPLLPGASEIVEVRVDLPTVDGGTSFRAVVDPEGDGAASAVLECDETNNEGTIGGVECNLLI